jgi:predicted DNA-binding transcriptional regulator AlpA
VENRFLTRTEFSKALGVSTSTISRGIKNETWPFNAYIRIGDHIRYPIALVTELIQKARGTDNNPIPIEETGGEELGGEVKDIEESKVNLLNTLIKVKKKKEEILKLNDKSTVQNITDVMAYFKRIMKDAPAYGRCTLVITFHDKKVVEIEKNMKTSFEHESQNAETDS